MQTLPERAPTRPLHPHGILHAESARLAAQDRRPRASPTPSPPSCTVRASPSATSRTTSETRRRSPSSVARDRLRSFGRPLQNHVGAVPAVRQGGRLNMILSEFAYANINLTMIQSRPTKQQLRQLHVLRRIRRLDERSRRATALNCLRLKLREVKVLGSYPVE